MFTMFCIGVIIGVALLSAMMAIATVKPDAFKLAVLALLLACLASQWALGSMTSAAVSKYQAISGGRGDGL